MKKNRLIGLTTVALALALLLSLSGSGWAATKNLLTGKIWTRMTQDEKVAYLWGGGDVVDVERYLMKEYPELKVENFSYKVRQGVSNDLTNNDAAAAVDKWYKANPDKLDVAVMTVIWDTLIKPNLKTGIAGRPLSEQ